MKLIKEWSLGLFLSACTLFLYLIEQILPIKLGVWWGFWGLSVVITALYILGSNYLIKNRKRHIFAGFYGFLTLVFKLAWEVFYIWVGLKQLATPAGLLIGGVFALAGFYFWLIRLRNFST